MRWCWLSQPGRFPPSHHFRELSFETRSQSVHLAPVIRPQRDPATRPHDTDPVLVHSSNFAASLNFLLLVVHSPQSSLLPTSNPRCTKPRRAAQEPISGCPIFWDGCSFSCFEVVLWAGDRLSHRHPLCSSRLLDDSIVVRQVLFAGLHTSTSIFPAPSALPGTFLFSTTSPIVPHSLAWHGSPTLVVSFVFCILLCFLLLQVCTPGTQDEHFVSLRYNRHLYSSYKAFQGHLVQ